MKAQHARLSGPRQRQHGRVVAVHDRPVVGRLVAEDAGLELAVLVYVAVAIEMVGREVQEYGQSGTKRLGALELEARDLEREDGPLAGLVQQARHGRADVASYAHVPARRRQHRPQRGGRRRLALGPGHRRDRPFDEPIRQLELPDHRHARRPRRQKLGLVPGHTGRDDHHLGGRERGFAMPAELQAHAQPRQLEGLDGDLVRRLAVGGHDARAAGGEKARRRDP